MKKTIHEGHAERYKFCRRYVQNKTVLDAACGFGAGSVILADVAKAVFGADLNEDELVYARTHCSKHNIKYVKADVTALPFADNFFDFAVSLETIEHLDQNEQTQFLNELRRLVKAGGYIIISTPDRNVWRKRMAIKQHDHKRELTKSELHQLLNQHFKVIDFYGQWKILSTSKVRKFIRFFLNFLKRADFLGLRYFLLPSNFRKNIDLKTSLVDQSHWRVERLNNEESASQLLVICEKIKN